MIYILTGVSGVGKTTMGKILSADLKLPFYDADDFHPGVNVQKMKNGIPLEDMDREAWLASLAENIRQWNKGKGAVLACSALKKKYRERLQSVPEKDITWIFLHSQYEVILKRLQARQDHYFHTDLLQSQYDALEVPGDGIHVNVNQSVAAVVEEIKKKISRPPSEIGLLGLGVMGKSLAINLASRKIQVAVFNRHVEDLEVDIARNFAREYKELYDFPWFDDLREFVNSLQRPRNILLMVNAGKTVDLVIEGLLPLLDEGDLIIDAGNSHYKDTITRERQLKEKGILFMGAGVSGGEEGARQGPSIMPGGTAEAYERAGGYLEKIAAKDKNGEPCCTHVGTDGAGHFVKMLHNGIEYGEMQLIAEVYHLLRHTQQKDPLEIAEIFENWNVDLRSYLLEISADILRTKEDGGFLIDFILDAAKQKGTGGWSTNAALELGVPLDTITAAVMARNISGKKQERVNAIELYSPLRKSGEPEEIPIPEMYKAFRAASIINHAIGFDLLHEASLQYHWKLNLSEISRIWTNGCIIKSAVMEDLVGMFKEKPDGNLLQHPQVVKTLCETEEALAMTTGAALKSGSAVPLLSAALNYFLTYTSGQSSANMIQAQRDYFGAHTYERTDRERGEFFHTKWKANN